LADPRVTPAQRKVKKASKENELDPQQKMFRYAYSAILKAGDFRTTYISDVVRVSKGLLKKWFAEDEHQKMVEQVMADTLTGALEFLERHRIEFIENLLVIARESPDWAVRLRANESGLDRTGLAKVNKSESKVVTDNRETREFQFAPEFWDQLEGLPLKTQQELAELSSQMEKIVSEAAGKE